MRGGTKLLRRSDMVRYAGFGGPGMIYKAFFLSGFPEALPKALVLCQR